MGLRLALLCLMLSSCEAMPKQVSNKKGIARVTFYNRHEDKYGSRIASSNKRRAVKGQTIAAERRYPFGTKIWIPYLAKLFGVTKPFIVEDRGSAVERRKASHGTAFVFDIYTDSKKETNRLAAIVPPYLPYEIQ